MRFITLVGVFLINTAAAQDWSDTMDLDENSLTTFVGESKHYGYKQNDKIVIKPKYEDAYNFHCDYASAKFNGRWGIISRNGKWKIKPTEDFISPVVDNRYIIYSDSTFFVCVMDGTKEEHGNLLKIDYLKYLELIKNSHDPDKDLILRIAQMYDPLNSDNRHDDLERFYKVLSRHLISFYWSTKWVLSEGLVK